MSLSPAGSRWVHLLGRQGPLSPVPFVDAAGSTTVQETGKEYKSPLFNLPGEDRQAGDDCPCDGKRFADFGNRIEQSCKMTSPDDLIHMICDTTESILRMGEKMLSLRTCKRISRGISQLWNSLQGKRAAASFAIGGILVELTLLLPPYTIQIQTSLFQIPIGSLLFRPVRFSCSRVSGALSEVPVSSWWPNEVAVFDR